MTILEAQGREGGLSEKAAVVRNVMSQHCHLVVNLIQSSATVCYCSIGKKKEGIGWTQQVSLTVVGGEHHHGAPGQSQLVQGAQQTTHLAVHVRHGSVIMLPYAQLEEEKKKQSSCSALLCSAGHRETPLASVRLLTWKSLGMGP